MKHFIIQRSTRYLLYVLAGFCMLGTFLDAISNAYSVVTPGITYGATGIIGLVLLLQKPLLQRIPVDWRSDNGQSTRIARLGIMPQLMLVGMLLLVWLPRVVSTQDSTPIAQSAQVPPQSAPASSQAKVSPPETERQVAAPALTVPVQPTALAPVPAAATIAVPPAGKPSESSGIHLSADGKGSKAVGGNVTANAGKIEIEAKNGGIAVGKDLHATGHDVSIKAEGGVGAQGDAVLTGK